MNQTEFELATLSIAGTHSTYYSTGLKTTSTDILFIKSMIPTIMAAKFLVNPFNKNPSDLSSMIINKIKMALQKIHWKQASDSHNNSASVTVIVSDTITVTKALLLSESAQNVIIVG